MDAIQGVAAFKLSFEEGHCKGPALPSRRLARQGLAGGVHLGGLDVFEEGWTSERGIGFDTESRYRREP